MIRQPLHALTLWQPWASAIMAGVKPWENRPWAPRQLLGETPEPLWVALHASRRLQVGPWATWDDLADLWPRATWPSQIGGLWPSGFLGLVRFDRAVAYPTPELEASPWAGGPLCWKVGQVLELPEPIPAKGHQRLWRVPDEDVPTFRALYARHHPPRS